MIRKLCTVGALMAALIGAGSAVAYADTPHSIKPATTSCVGTIGGITGVVGVLIDGVCSAVGTTDTDATHHHHYGGHFYGGGFYGGGFYPGGFYRNLNSGVVLPYSQVASACGCAGSTLVPTGYALVPAPQPQIVQVPVGAVATGDGSCATLPASAYGRLGGRFWR